MSVVPPNIVVLSGSTNPTLAAALARELGLSLGRCAIQRFPDGEKHVEVDPREIEGRDVVFVQPTPNGASEATFELLLAADACRSGGARSIAALVPYFGCARQDRRKHEGEALGARVAAKALGAARLDLVVAVDLHGETAEASLDCPTEHVSAAPVLSEALTKVIANDSVVVAPDLGAARLAREYARILGLPFAVAQKLRTSATDVLVEHVAGEVHGLRPIIVDDIIATGSTMVAAARALREKGCANEIVVAATHGVFAPGALDRLRDAGIQRFFVTDTISSAPTGVTVVSVAPLLATCVRRFARRRLGSQ